MSFKDQVLVVVAAIPEGETLSYKAVATLAGNRKAARAVGMILKRNTDPTIPCHRVIRSDGSLGGYNGLWGISKEILLDAEKLSKK